MLGRLRRRATYANVMSSLALFAALGGGAYAATNAYIDSSGVIHGCVNPKAGGDVHVVKPGKNCRKGSTAVAWSQTGPQGPKGAAGAEGKEGKEGKEGQKGAQGIEGKPGKEGKEGGANVTRYGNVLVEKEHEVLLAEVGHFQFWGKCEASGSSRTVKKTTTDGNSIDDEDEGTLNGNFNTTSEVSGDEDYDEAGYMRDNATGLTLQYLDYSFDAAAVPDHPEDCEFQGVITQTS
jgi:hypothetical protein